MVKQLLGIKPFSFQKDVINEVINAKGTGKIVVVKSRRQVGKSVLISNLLLYYAINFSNTRNYVLSPTSKQGKKLYKSIITAIEKSGIIKSKNATDLVITFINGSSIYFKSAEQREALRGETCTGLLAIDECAYISDDIYNIVKPWVDFWKAVTLMVSTPFIKNGFFYQYYNYGLDNQYNTVTIDWCDVKYQEDLNIILPPERLEEYKKVLPKNVFKTEYLGLFLDDEGTVFTEYMSCVKAKQIGKNDKLYVGLDWATGNDGDDTAMSIVNQNGEQVYLEYFNNISSTQQIKRISTILEKFEKQIVVVQTELNSLGTPLTDFLKERSRIPANKFIGFNTTNQTKNALVTNLQMAFEKKEVSILDDDKQLRELSYYSAEYNAKTRNVSYNAPQGLHDDLCIALMLSYDAYKNGSATGSYSLSFPQKKKYVLKVNNKG